MEFSEQFWDVPQPPVVKTSEFERVKKSFQVPFNNFDANRKEKQDHSNLSKFFHKDITHRDSIRSGYLIEDGINAIINDCDKVVDARKKYNLYTIEEDGKVTQIDVLYETLLDNSFTYLEIKTNLNLDTEKFPAMCDKINKVKKYLTEKFPNKKITCGVLSIWWCGSDITEQFHLDKYYKNNIRLFFMSDLFNDLGMNINHVHWDYIRTSTGELIVNETNN